METAKQSLELLVAGNQRFVDGQTRKVIAPYADRDIESLLAKRPVAVVIGCSDARVPTERIFDQDIGDLFVIRTAGNFVTDSQIGSIEFAMDELDVRLVVVMGHTGCGAVAETLHDIADPERKHPRYYTHIVDRIRPAMAELIDSHTDLSEQEISKLAIRANVRASIKKLESSSRLQQARRDHALLVMGAEYSLSTGRVEFFAA